MSQLGQDLWVLERTGDKTGGFFVEFGATDGVLLSNTWLLEQHFGWRGLCAEPNPGFYRQLQANRHCTVSAACIGAPTCSSWERCGRTIRCSSNNSARWERPAWWSQRRWVQTLHQQCTEALQAVGYAVLVSADFDQETTSYDGFLLAVSLRLAPVGPGR